MANGPTQADLRKAATVITENDVQDLRELLNDLKGRVEKAREDGRTFMMLQYVRLVSTVSPQVTKLEQRMEREDLAAFRRMHKQLKEEQTAQSGANGSSAE